MQNKKTPPSIFCLPSSAQKGFALLFAMFVASIMLSVGLGISNVIYKELVLSGIGRESEVSFYNAQTGLECALALDNKDTELYATSVATGNGLSVQHKCDGNNIYGVGYQQDLQGATTTFQFDVNYPSPSPAMCTSVLVYKAAANYMTVESRGYNTSSCPDPLAPSTNSRRVERSLKLRTNIVPASGS